MYRKRDEKMTNIEKSEKLIITKKIISDLYSKRWNNIELNDEID